MVALLDAGASASEHAVAAFAAGRGHAGVLELVLRAGADPDARGDDGATALAVCGV